jgi:predicted hydrocarbon binding protein
MLWDPKRFPMMVYEMNKEDGPAMFKLMKENKAVKRALFPFPKSLFLRFMPKSFSKVKDMKKLAKGLDRDLPGGPKQERAGIMEYLEDASKTDEHYFRMYESSECWGFENVGTTMLSYSPPIVAGSIKAFESWRGLERDWNVIETKCVGLGDPYCEFKLVPRENGELNEFLEKDSSAIKKIHDRLMTRLMGFLLEGKALVERPRLGSDAQLRLIAGVTGIPIMAGERYRMAWRMGGAKVGKEVGEHLIEAGIKDDEAVKRILNFLEYCKVGELSKGETIRIKENCESIWVKGYAPKWKEPCCFFTTGFLNGFFSAVKNQHVKETKCIAMGDPYCEWKFS